MVEEVDYVVLNHTVRDFLVIVDTGAKPRSKHVLKGALNHFD